MLLHSGMTAGRKMAGGSRASAVLGTVEQGARWLRRSANALTGLAVLAVVIAGLQHLFANPDFLPLQRVVVQGKFKRVAEAEVADVLRLCRGSNLVTCDLRRVQAALEALPWIDAVSLRRVWPDALAVAVVEQQPVARWERGGLLNSRGELFHPPVESYPVGLSVLHGPADSEEDLLGAYRRMVNLLLGASLTVRRLEMDERQAWRVSLYNEIELVLGRGPGEERLERFVRAWPAVLAGKADRVERIDLRYPNGFAVQWRALAGGQERHTG